MNKLICLTNFSLLLFFILSVDMLNAQLPDTIEYPIPEITIQVGVEGNKIYYDFYRSNCVIDSLIKLSTKNQTCFIKISSAGFRDNIQILIGVHDKNCELLNVSNRFFKSKLYDVPIMFDFDFDFSTPNQSFFYLYKVVIRLRDYEAIEITKFY